MHTDRRLLLLFLAFSFAVMSLPILAQQVIATVPAGYEPGAVQVNPVTNKIYVANFGDSTVSVIDGATNSAVTVPVGPDPLNIAVNQVTNKIYVTNYGSYTVTVIDGATNSTATVVVGLEPVGVGVNSVTNKIYVTNQYDDTVTVIDGVSLTTTTVTVGYGPSGVAINAVTNKIYVADDNGCVGNGTVTVIDGANNSTTSVLVGVCPGVVAVNPVTNKIYVVNGLDNGQNDTVTVFDGVTLSTTTVNVGLSASDLAVDAVTNKIYVANAGSNTVTVIDGATNSTTTVSVGNYPDAIAANPVTDQIYVVDRDGYVIMIDGATLSKSWVAVGNAPDALAINSVTNRIYVVNECGDDPTCSSNGTVSVIAGGTNLIPLQFVAVTPCRLVDTRKSGGPIQGGTSQNFIVPQEGGCNIPTTAVAYSLNVTVVPSGQLGYLTIWPTGEDQPVVSTMNSLDGRIKANAAIVPAGYQAAVSVYVSNTTNVILDIDGYFVPASGSTLAFYPLTPCRVLDTRKPNGDLGGPYLASGQERDFPVLSSNCDIPSSAQAYSMNFTVVPYQGQSLGYLTVWAQGDPKPVVSTLNNLTATIVANAAIVPAGTGGGIAAYPSGNTQLVADIDGYFAPVGSGGLSLYTGSPCRVIDTRKGGGAFSGKLAVDVVDSVCAPPTTAQAYVFNATVVPGGGLGYLTLWPDSQNQPVVSTLNAIDGAITSNMAIVPNINGKTDAYASGITQLILDISSYFAP
jgi:YVTN family beta-propeller protein